MLAINQEKFADGLTTDASSKPCFHLNNAVEFEVDECDELKNSSTGKQGVPCETFITKEYINTFFVLTFGHY